MQDIFCWEIAGKEAITAKSEGKRNLKSTYEFCEIKSTSRAGTGRTESATSKALKRGKLKLDCESVEVTLETFDSAFVTDAGAENNAVEFITENGVFVPTNDGAGVTEPNKFDIPGRCQSVIREELENYIELLIVTGLLACDELPAIASKPNCAKWLYKAS